MLDEYRVGTRSNLIIVISLVFVIKGFFCLLNGFESFVRCNTRTHSCAVDVLEWCVYVVNVVVVMVIVLVGTGQEMEKREIGN